MATDQDDSKPFRILSLDGGGVRGVFSAKILELIEKKLGIKINQHFDLIVGTSTGSISAAAVATDYDLDQLVQQYTEMSKEVFPPQGISRCWKGLFSSQYKTEPLENFLKDAFGEIRMGQIDRPLILNATNVTKRKVHLFKSRYQEGLRRGDYVRDGDVPLYRAVLASCAAPLYFDPVEIDSNTLVCDGGVWANNPALVGYVDAISNFKRDPADIKILSIGTGTPEQDYASSQSWGFCSGWKGRQLVDFLMRCQTDFPTNCLQLLNPGNIFRINPPINSAYALDFPKAVPTLISTADSEFTDQSQDINKFLGG